MLDLPLDVQVGQVFMAPVFGERLNEETTQFLAETHLGNIIYFDRADTIVSPEQLKELSRQLKETIEGYNGISPLIAVDQEGGRVQRLRIEKGFVGLESAKDFPQVEKQAKELAELGITTNLAPVVDVVQRDDCPIGTRSFGSDTNEVIACAKVYIEQMQKHGVQTVLKHYPGLGKTAVDSHKGLPVGEPQLEPFAALMDKADAIMSAHVLVPSLDEETCATLSSKIMTRVLREEMDYKKVVISDSFSMKGVIGEIDSFDEAVEKISKVAICAFNAGCDMMIIDQLQFTNYKTTPEGSLELFKGIIRRFNEAVESGEVSRERLGASVTRILEMKKKA